MRKKYLKKFLVDSLIIITAIIVTLAVIVHVFPVLSIDVEISRKIQENGGSILLEAMKLISMFGNAAGLLTTVASASAIFYFFSYRREALFLISTIAVDAATLAIKYIVNRPRPDSSLVSIYAKVTDPGFPSGHVVHYTVFFGLIFVFMLRLKKIPILTRILISYICLNLIFLVPISRIYLGVHWLTDVIGGYLVGLSFLIVLLYLYFYPKTLKKLSKRFDIK
ncbi:TPA: hypothetical protein DDW69_02945 [candidate division CPR2 bacterium]|uniref:Membrane-associated phospholipid phosphatase n=1 Tax=candidate division CPR2 bacterium GW2011_GWC1_41_48 TaxID=1618344 RepID=A0A0G0W842_UNCC2|nr:MAG: Membrane-associated phospholipid phosphatase [candidate division CPR2 bacterium GW2011_GWC2_39_35]KKR27642.1 MAG: Membrane-associated phospholipid phosphatase [candidate division CPR2 bacterium GW2011_GWD1_39_7]KKR29202.1 MAG: Membrane-associated phospholipid phosphatase [candidate division CPR2 bacterium GW2011_GWD2_39_7]KKS09154.1 MAG: Membrane-associated phospholipid phosphatase [candidate division CPR2 bacterium GW2011_GWC1_41_48]OGB59459.1 MAG: hypothetical protein A2Y27_01150 [can